LSPFTTAGRTQAADAANLTPSSIFDFFGQILDDVKNVLMSDFSLE
jgi:hypothetical protein